MSNLTSESFSELMATDRELMAIRREYSLKTAKQRRVAAQLQYDTECAEELFSSGLPLSLQRFGPKIRRDAGVISLAIDPLFAPAILTVGSLEYQYKRIDEAMALFLKLTELSPREPDLPEIIDKAGDFLTDNKDYENALRLYDAAEKAFPKEALYYAGSGYCLDKLKRFEAAIKKYEKAVALSPENYKFLNDYGYTVYEAGRPEEALRILERAQSLSPPDYDLPENNIRNIRKKLTVKGRQDSRQKGKRIRRKKTDSR